MTRRPSTRDDTTRLAEGFFRLAYASLPDSISPIKNIAVMKIRQASENNDDPAILGEAVTLLDEVLVQRPGAYDLLADKANVLAKLGRTDEATRIYDDLLREHGSDTFLLNDMAQLAVQDGKLRAGRGTVGPADRSAGGRRQSRE